MITQELVGDTFRRAEIKVIECRIPSENPELLPQKLSVSLAQIFLCISRHFPTAPLVSLLQHEKPSVDSIGPFSYMLASLLPLPLDTQIGLLEETCPFNRIALIESWLSQMTGEPLGGDASSLSIWDKKGDKDGQDYPPNFSLN